MDDRKHTVDPEAMQAFGRQVDFGLTAKDYAHHRAGFPRAFFDCLSARGYAIRGQDALDLGTGTGTVARGLAGLGLQVTGLDPSLSLMQQAARLDRAAGVQVIYREGRAEATGVATASADLVTAGQCWHWFDRPAAAQETARVLRPGGRLIIAHFDWLPLPGNMVEATEALILRYNPEWAGAGGSGIYPAWTHDMAAAGFEDIETLSFDLEQPYSHVAWRGRVRASAGVAASLGKTETERFDADLAALLKARFPDDPLAVPHRIWLATGRHAT